jgi:ATP-dependent HslUV protease ATP-binding subunit HslU
MNTQTENLGARRLHALIEKVIEEISFNANNFSGSEFIIDRAYVQ